MNDDLANLIGEARDHREITDSNPEVRSDCEVCDELWPCLVSRLAGKLARQRQVVEASKALIAKPNRRMLQALTVAVSAYRLAEGE